MTKTYKPDLSPAEQDLLDHVTVRLIRPEERAAFDELLIKEHYLHNAELVGEPLRYVAEYAGQWMALLTCNAAAFNLRLRETWIGWTPQQKKRRLTLVVTNSRFTILPHARIPNLASRVMKRCLQRVSSDWLQTYGHEVLVVKSGRWLGSERIADRQRPTNARWRLKWSLGITVHVPIGGRSESVGGTLEAFPLHCLNPQQSLAAKWGSSHRFRTPTDKTENHRPPDPYLRHGTSSYLKPEASTIPCAWKICHSPSRRARFWR